MNLRAQQDFIQHVRDAYPNFDPKTLLFYEEVAAENKAKGKEEGREEGREEGKLEMIIGTIARLKDKGFSKTEIEAFLVDNLGVNKAEILNAYQKFGK